MAKNTVGKKIFKTNNIMILITLIVLIVINIAVVEIYSEIIETEFLASVEGILTKDQMKDLVENWTVKKDSFYVLFVIDGIVCVLSAVLISSRFTKNLAAYITKPMDSLTAGANRIKNGELTENVEYSGDDEFAEVCSAFNDMQSSLLAEREKTKSYEKARADMTAGISHDIRTPLTVVKGSIKAVMDGVVDGDAAKKLLETAYSRTDDINSMLEQLFYISKLETGSMPMNMQKIDISDFIKKYADEKKCTNGDIKLSFETGSDFMYVMADIEQLKRIFDNLYENSRKYAKSDKLEISIKAEEKGDKCEIRFSDNGIGVEEDKLEHIFEEFYRCDAARNNRNGSGLGLYTVKCLVEAMNGKVNARNENGLAVYIILSAVKEN